MGGSHLAAGLFKLYDPQTPFYIHRDYGLPVLSDEELKESLIIASSYSGNTEEVVDFLEKALEKGLNAVVISVGGKLVDMAQEHNLPHIVMPNTGIQPRSALGFSVVALAKFLGRDDILEELSSCTNIDPLKWEEEGKKLASTLHGRVPVVYSSLKNEAIAYNWKIKFNETGKIPAFYNTFSELNHNEMTGFDVIDTTRSLSENNHFILLLMNTIIHGT